MAIITNNRYLHGARGMFGGVIVFRQLRGRTIMQARPKRPTLESAVQKENRSQFAKASAYAKAAMLDPQLKEQYREQAKRMKLPNPYTAALTLKLRDLKALVDERQENVRLNQEAKQRTSPRAQPPEPFKNMNLKEYLLYSSTTGKRLRRKYKPTSPRPVFQKSVDIVERCVGKTLGVIDRTAVVYFLKDCFLNFVKSLTAII